MRASARRCRPFRRRDAARARVLVMSHIWQARGRQVRGGVFARPVAKRLAQLLGLPVPLKKDWLGGVDVQPGRSCCWKTCAQQGQRRTADDLAQKMAALCDVYVMDASYGDRAKRVRRSAKYAPVACAGPPPGQRIVALETALREARAAAARHRGRLKVSTNSRCYAALLGKVESVDRGRRHHQYLFGGVGFNVGKSLCEPAMLDICRTLLSSQRSAVIVIPMPHRRGGRHSVLREG